MYSLAVTINTHGPLGASTYTVVRARLRLNTRGQPGIPTRSFSLCALPAPRQIHDAGRPSHVLPMAIHRSVHEAKGARCGRLPGTVVALGSSGSSASLRKMRRDFIPPRRCQSTSHLLWLPLVLVVDLQSKRREGETEQCSPRPRRGTPSSSFVVSFHRHNEQCGQDQHRSVSYYIQ